MKKQPEISSNFFNRLDHMLIFKSNLPIRKDKMTLFYDMILYQNMQIWNLLFLNFLIILSENVPQ